MDELESFVPIRSINKDRGNLSKKELDFLKSKKRYNDEISLTDIYVEENKTTPKGGKYVVFEYTLESDMDTKPYLKMFGEEGHSLTYCKMFIGDKLDNVIVVKLRQNGKVVAEYKADAKKCSSKLK